MEGVRLSGGGGDELRPVPLSAAAAACNRRAEGDEDEEEEAVVAFRSHEGVSRLQRLMLETDGGFKGREEEAVEGE